MAQAGSLPDIAEQQTALTNWDGTFESLIQSRLETSQSHGEGDKSKVLLSLQKLYVGGWVGEARAAPCTEPVLVYAIRKKKQLSERHHTSRHRR